MPGVIARDLSSSAVALSLLVLAALLAGLGGAVRALKSADGRSRSRLLGTAVGGGIIATAISLAPIAFGASSFSPDLSSLSILAVAGAVATADLVEVGVAVTRVIRSWPARSALQAATEATRASDPARAAAAYRIAIPALVAGAQQDRELQARLELAATHAAAGDLERAGKRVEEALERARSLGSPELCWRSLLRAAAIEADLDRTESARVHLGEAATIARERLTEQHIASVFAELAWTAYVDADPDLARTALSWAGRSAGRIDPASAFATDTTLLAAFLAMANGDLIAAEGALGAFDMTLATTADPDLSAGLLVARCCLRYLQGWRDSARSTLQAELAVMSGARRRSRVVIPLVALTLQARGSNRDTDAAAIGRMALDLAPAGGTLAGLAAYCSNPKSDPFSDPRPVLVARLLSRQLNRPAS